MSHRHEFIADVNDGQIALPNEIASRLRLKGVHRVRVVVTSMAEETVQLAARGIDAETIDRVATAQSFDRDIASTVLRGEVVAHGTVLGDRLAELLRGQSGASE